MQARNTYDRSAIFAGYTGPSSSFKQTPAIPEDDYYEDDIEEDDDSQEAGGTPQVCLLTHSICNSR
jgi:hypothetical protein